MDISKIVRTLALSIGTSATCVGLWMGCNFYFHHNTNYEVDDKKVFQKVDAIFAHTKVEINEDGSVEIARYSPLGTTRFYNDEDGDGMVDRIFICSNVFARGSYDRAFYRDRQLKQHPSVFKKADQDFRQQIKRFKLL